MGACQLVETGIKMQEHDAFTVADFAERHGISRAMVYVELRQGRLIASKVGTRTIITKEAADAWRSALPPMKPGEVGRSRRRWRGIEATGPEVA
jgi:hypothetical protein